MYERTQELEVPMMAGSVIPLVWRDPPDFEIPRDEPMTEAVVLFHGSLHSYGFHGLEMLQSLVEGRAGGETGVRRVETLSGADFYAAMEDGRIPRDIVDRILQEHAGFSLEERPIEEHVGDRARVIFLDYYDGMRAALLQLEPYYRERWFFGARVGGEVMTCQLKYVIDPDRGPEQPVAAFSYQGLNVQEMFLTGRPQLPIERSLLTTGLSEAAVHSLHYGRAIDTPHLAIEYEAYDFDPIRPKAPRPEGASIAPWPEDEELRPLFER